MGLYGFLFSPHLSKMREKEENQSKLQRTTRRNKYDSDSNPQRSFRVLKPEFIAPFVAYICHESYQDTDALYEVEAFRWQSKME